MNMYGSRPTLNSSLPRRKPNISAATLLLVMVCSGTSFFAGTLFALNAGINKCAPTPGSPPKPRESSSNSQQQQQQPGEEEQNRLLERNQEGGNDGNLFPETVRRYAVGMARTSKEDFTSMIDLGVPLDASKPGEEDVLILYSKTAAMPNDEPASTTIPLLSAKKAVRNCAFVNVILAHHSGDRNQCFAIVPQYESYHIQKWMRLSPDLKGKPDMAMNLQFVSRGYQGNGVQQFASPKAIDTKRHWDMLKDYLNSIDEVVEELKPIVEKIAVQNTIIVMVCNFGQSELLLNFACSAHSKNLDISNVLVFATDLETKELAESVGLAAYFDERNFGKIPLEAAKQYGDKKFVAMMMAKVVCVQIISYMGYDLLFQDVDIVWYKHPLSYFHDKKSPIHNFDVYFQDDGAHSTRYAPYSANSGFYYIRQNDRTRHFLTALLMSGDMVLKWDSHQQAMVAVMAEHASLFGLRVKVLSRDEDEFPGGYHYHQKSGLYMRALFNGEKDPYIFHMSWTKNKDNKLLFLKQLGEWYVQEQCISKKLSEIGVESKEVPTTCCSKEPLFSCHYRDKPSVKPCKDSPPIDKGKKSFW